MVFAKNKGADQPDLINAIVARILSSTCIVAKNKPCYTNILIFLACLGLSKILSQSPKTGSLATNGSFSN